MRVLAVDPGNKGALALIDTTACTLTIWDMPTEASTKGRQLTSSTDIGTLARDVSPDHVFLEEVGVRPGEGAVGAFSFGRGLGRLEGAFATALIPVWLIRPNEWKSKMVVKADKGQAVTRAKQLFPAAASLFTGPRGGLMDGRAEAALIALYGALKLGQTPNGPLSVVMPDFL